MMKLTAAVVLFTVLCVAPPGHGNIESVSDPSDASSESPTSLLEAEPWIGKTVEELKSIWGEPTRVKKRKGGARLLVYKVVLVGGTMVAPGASILVAPGPYQTGPIAGARSGTDPYPANSTGAVYLTTPGSAAAEVEKKIKVKFLVDRYGTVLDAEFPDMKAKK
jgi:hypothetical protein